MEARPEMFKIYYLLYLLSFVLLLSCSEEKKDALSASSGQGNGPPNVVSAAIRPEKPTAANPLVLNCSAADPEGDFIQYNVQWYVDNELIQEGNATSLEPGKYKKGAVVYAKITPSDPFSSGNVFTTSEIRILNQPPVITSASLTPDDPPVGTVVTVTVTGADPDEDQVTYLYEWRVNEKRVTDKQATNQFNTTGLKKKDLVYAALWATDGEQEGEIAASNIIVLSNNAPQITSAPSTNLSNGNYTYQVTAQDPDKDRLTYNLESAPPGMTINASNGMIQWSVPEDVAERQEIPIKIKVDDGDGGTAYQEYSLFLEMK
jgi:hypothetical protein